MNLPWIVKVLSDWNWKHGCKPYALTGRLDLVLSVLPLVAIPPLFTSIKESAALQDVLIGLAKRYALLGPNAKGREIKEWADLIQLHYLSVCNQSQFKSIVGQY